MDHSIEGFGVEGKVGAGGHREGQAPDYAVTLSAPDRTTNCRHRYISQDGVAASVINEKNARPAGASTNLEYTHARADVQRRSKLLGLSRRSVADNASIDAKYLALYGKVGL